MPAAKTVASRIKLNNGAVIPQLGLGVWQISDGQPVKEAVLSAFEVGYRHVDTAKIYGNESGVGEAIRESGLPREDIWVTTKLWPSDILRADRAVESSLNRLGLEYVDLYLVHWPIPGMNKRAWKALEKIYQRGQAKSIGVSNYSARQIKDILEQAATTPAVNQIKISPFGHDEETIQFCREKGIALEAYSPLTRARLLGDKRLGEVAAKYHKTTAQILIRWSLQQGFIVLPKSQNPGRIKENADVFDFEIASQDMSLLDSLSL